MLRVENVSMQVEGVSLLQDVSLEVNAGEVVALVGPNGAGKSSFIRVACGERKADQGKVLFDNAELSEWPAADLAQRMSLKQVTSAR